MLSVRSNIRVQANAASRVMGTGKPLGMGRTGLGAGVSSQQPSSGRILYSSSSQLRVVVASAENGDSLYTRVDAADTIESNLWGFLAVSALCGTVTGSVMFWKTGNPKYVWVCAGAPVLALLAGVMRERARQEAQRDQIILLISDLRKELTAVRTASSTAAAAATSNQGGNTALVQDMRELVRYVDSSRSLLQRVEGKITTLEQQVSSAGRNAQEASVVATRLRQESQGSTDAIVTALRRELSQLQLQSTALQGASVGGMQDAAYAAAVARLEGRLASLESSIAGLESSQSESLRRFSSSFASAVSDPSGALQSSLRMEVSKALEPLRDSYALATSPSSPPGVVPPLAPWALQREAEVELTERERARLREVVKDEVQRGVGQILSEQEQALREVAAQPVTLGPEQWSALGNRLRGIERVLSQIPEEQRKALEAWNQSGPLSEALRSVQDTITALQATKGGAEASSPGDAGGEEALRRGLDDVSARLRELQRAADARDVLLQEVLGQLSARISQPGPSTAAGGAAGTSAPSTSSVGAYDIGAGSEAVAALVREYASSPQDSGAADGTPSTSTPNARALPAQSAQTPFSQFLDTSKTEFAASARELQEIVTAGAVGKTRATPPEKPVASNGAAAPPAKETAAAPTMPAAPAPEAPQQPVAPSTEAAATKPAASTPRPSSLPPAAAPSEAASAAASLPFMALTGIPIVPGQQRPVTPADIEKGMKKALGLLKSGREQARTNAGLAAAEASLRLARDIFEKIAEMDPTSVQALGNLGNSLLALGQLRVQQAELVEANGGGPADANDPSLSPGQLEDEASGFLVQAGRRFRQAYEANLREVRALCNWGQALSIRAKLAGKEDPERAAELYEAAIEKFQAVIDAEPRTMPALRLLAVALREYGMLSADGTLERAECLESALEVVGRALEVDPGDEALRRLEEDLQEKLEVCVRFLQR